jgi:hypothetical protein
MRTHLLSGSELLNKTIKTIATHLYYFHCLTVQVYLLYALPGHSRNQVHNIKELLSTGEGQSFGG